MPSSPASPANSHDDQPVVQNPRILHIERVDIAPYTNTQLGDVINIGPHYWAQRTPDAERDPHLRRKSTLDQSWFKAIVAGFSGGIATSYVGDVIKAWFAAAFHYAQHYASSTYQASLQFIHQMSAQNGCTGSVCLVGFLVNFYVFGGATTSQILMGVCHLLGGLATLVSVVDMCSAYDTFDQFPTQYRAQTSLDVPTMTSISLIGCLLSLDHVVVQLVEQDIIKSYLQFLYANLAYWIFLRCIAAHQNALFSWEWIEVAEDIFCRYVCPGTMEFLEVTTIMCSKVGDPRLRLAVYQVAGRVAVSAFTMRPGRSQIRLPIFFQIPGRAFAILTTILLGLALTNSLKQSSLGIGRIRHLISTQDYTARSRLRSQQR
ncbi:hypothetical protein LTR70_001749 [Exophiala xenobiotica]|uniref:Uncharacterized protein n=1 Tax=Lithohypha guttulata TaxID=1690604 RepID=A0ABR0KM34_9EURO|nr:hypothetical protein LTR24_001058 [Lithohypha guttulata]KAK5327007.1 hypothetical protein LTR70_001749 [Exophiala xenobiotica]